LKRNCNWYIYEAIQELYEELGGIALELLMDNPKALLIDNNLKSEDEVKYNAQALRLWYIYVPNLMPVIAIGQEQKVKLKSHINT